MCVHAHVGIIEENFSNILKWNDEAGIIMFQVYTIHIITGCVISVPYLCLQFCKMQCASIAEMSFK